MKLRNYVLLGTAGLALGVSSPFAQPTASASTWHSSSLPAKLRGTWHGKYTGQKLYVYRHTIRYAGEKAMTHIKWHYAGNNYYRLKGHGFTDSTLFHYISRHKLTTYSMEHTFYK